MSGRAGRRGLDDKGVVVLMLDTKMEPGIAKEMVKGAPDTLHSEFHLGYNMLLNMLRYVSYSPRSSIKMSFLSSLLLCTDLRCWARLWLKLAALMAHVAILGSVKRAINECKADVSMRELNSPS